MNRCDNCGLLTDDQLVVGMCRDDNRCDKRRRENEHAQLAFENACEPVRRAILGLMDELANRYSP